MNVDMSVFESALTREGALIEVGAHQPFLLDDPERAWYVATGGIMLFTVALENGLPRGTRTHVIDLEPGQLLLGFDLHRQQSGAGFLAVARAGTTLRRLPIARLRELANAPPQAAAIARLIDAWIRGLSTSLGRSLAVKHNAAPILAAHVDVECSPRASVTSATGVVWIEIQSGGIRFDDLAVPRFTTRQTLFPVAPDAWIQAIDDELGPLAVRPASTLDALRDDALWHGLQVFNDVLCECELTHRRQAEDDEFERLEEKARYRERAQDLAYAAIGSVLGQETETPPEFLTATTAEPVLRACQMAGRALGLSVRAHPDASPDLTFEDRVAAIASASGFRTRLVVLRDGWWQHDHGPLVGQSSESKAPVALLPINASRYEMLDGATGRRTPLDAASAATLTPFAYACYRPFPQGSQLRARDMVRFGAWGIKPDVYALIGTAIGVGLFGTITPYLTGRIFDSAIPQADRQMLLAFGFALAASAVAMSMFKLVQGVAAVRVQARMEYAIQSAMWDRLLSLPASFFRAFSAGDLADRVGGVDVIQTLMSGAGVAAILGAISGLFFIAQMLTYSFVLAMAAVGLTIVFVGCNMLANYLQLRYQREEARLKGRIAGLVLNLITGVSKVRTSGAEPHAFRVWAQEFAQQRRLAFKAGTIQAGATVFSTTFPIASSMVIFLVMLGDQQQAATEGGAAALTTGEFIAFTTAYGLFLAAMQALGDASLNLLRAVPVYERFAPILSTPPEVDSTRAFPGKLTGEIELSHVSFRYSDDGPWILRDVSLKMAPGEFVAFVGPSGCGKSTMMRLMLGFERPTSGTIYYDGQDLNSLDLRLVRQQMGVVLQQSRVLPTEIYRNILGASSSRTIDDAWEAAEMAGLADDIRNMPMGMHTYVSEGGGTLSGGQRQRLLIARAIVHRPKIMFLDEATSALDNRAQSIITGSLDRLDATRIVIAHRLSTIVNADRICFLDGGKITEQGTHGELMERAGAFARLATRQMA
jgi:NHLM bacteriocin system ABC transporter ATP-binding protein